MKSEQTPVIDENKQPVEVCIDMQTPEEKKKIEEDMEWMIVSMSGIYLGC